MSKTFKTLVTNQIETFLTGTGVVDANTTEIEHAVMPLGYSQRSVDGGIGYLGREGSLEILGEEKVYGRKQKRFRLRRTKLSRKR
jgi:hypothetical protein